MGSYLRQDAELQALPVKRECAVFKGGAEGGGAPGPVLHPVFRPRHGVHNPLIGLVLQTSLLSAAVADWPLRARPHGLGHACADDVRADLQGPADDVLEVAVGHVHRGAACVVPIPAHKRASGSVLCPATAHVDFMGKDGFTTRTTGEGLTCL